MASDGAAVEADSPAFPELIAGLRRSFESLESRSLLLFGGKGGVGKTTLSALAALHFSRDREVVLFSSDPASNLLDLFTADIPASLRIERLDAGKLYEAYLRDNLEYFLELGDRGTYLDRDEIRRLLELSLPGIDELMAWMHAGDLVTENPGSTVIVDTAPTGHTLRMIASSEHFEGFGRALDAMQDKHRELVEQLTRRRSHDSIDSFVEKFRADAQTRTALMTDKARTAFIPVMLAEPWVVAQTIRLTAELLGSGIDVPFTILNRATHGCDCNACRNSLDDEKSATEIPGELVLAPRSCAPLDSTKRLMGYLEADDSGTETNEKLDVVDPAKPEALRIPPTLRALFFAGKGGVGKTTSASSVALRLARENPSSSYRLVSVDPAHSVVDVFAEQEPPDNLVVETIRTRAEWERLRSNLGREIERAIDRLTSSGISLTHDTNVMSRLIEMAPPGADEIFAIIRLHELLFEERHELVIVDTAPTGHFLRLIELPETAGEWVREFMRILLRYRELIPPSSLGEQLIRASKGLSRIRELLRSSEAGVAVVMRPERLVAAETSRLIATLESRGIAVQAVIANYVTPRSDCRCDHIRRAFELEILAGLNMKPVMIERQDSPVTDLDELASLVPLDPSPSPGTV